MGGPRSRPSFPDRSSPTTAKLYVAWLCLFYILLFCRYNNPPLHNDGVFPKTPLVYLICYRALPTELGQDHTSYVLRTYYRIHYVHIFFVFPTDAGTRAVCRTHPRRPNNFFSQQQTGNRYFSARLCVSVTRSTKNNVCMCTAVSMECSRTTLQWDTAAAVVYGRTAVVPAR